MMIRSKKLKKIFHIACAVGVALNTVMIVHNIVIDNLDWALLNFSSGLVLLISYENGRNENDEQ